MQIHNFSTTKIIKEKRARTVSVSEEEAAKRGHPREYCACNENTFPRRRSLWGIGRIRDEEIYEAGKFDKRGKPVWREASENIDPAKKRAWKKRRYAKRGAYKSKEICEELAISEKCNPVKWGFLREKEICEGRMFDIRWKLRKKPPQSKRTMQGMEAWSIILILRTKKKT